MSGAVAAAANPLACVWSLTGSLQSTGAVAGVWLTLTFGNNVTSVLSGLIDRPTTSRFRALAAGYYEVNYSAKAYMAANQRGGTFRILKNGVTDVIMHADLFANNILERSGTASASAILLLAANDYLELQANPHDATVMRVKDDTSLSFRLLRLI
jgi:hypothetical protein